MPIGGAAAKLWRLRRCILYRKGTFSTKTISLSGKKLFQERFRRIGVVDRTNQKFISLKKYHWVQSPRRSINYEILQKLKNKFECPSKKKKFSILFWRVFMMNMIFGSQHVFSKAAAGSREKSYKNPVRWELCKIRLVFAASQSKNGKNLRRIKRERNVVKFWHNRLFKKSVEFMSKC